jgi:hypothetical protein
MKQYSMIQAPVLAFFSKELYRDVGRNWRARSFIYLLLLVAACWIPEALEMRARMTRFAGGQGAAVVQQIPPITITDGIVSIDAEQPHAITEPDSEEVFAILDTTGEVTSLDDTPARVLLTRNQLFGRKSTGELRIYNLSDVKEFRLDRDLAQRWLDLATSWIIVLVAPVLILGSYVLKIAQALLYAIVGILIAKNVDADLGYGALVSLAMVALTPAIVAKTLMSLVDIQTGGLLMIMVFVAGSIFYLGYGIHACAHPAQEGQPSRFAPPTPPGD